MSQEEWFRFNSDGEPISSFVIKEWDEGEDEDFDGVVETERNIESKVLAVIHAYDETAESKLSRIWKILGEKA